MLPLVVAKQRYWGLGMPEILHLKDLEWGVIATAVAEAGSNLKWSILALGFLAEAAAEGLNDFLEALAGGGAALAVGGEEDLGAGAIFRPTLGGRKEGREGH